MYRILISILLFNFLFTQDYPAPINLNSYVDNGNIDIDWGEIIIDNISGYKIYRNDDELLLTTNNNYTDRDINSEIAYCYTVTALYNNSIESEHSNMSCTSWQINPPIDFSIEADNQEVSLAWEEPDSYNEYTIGYHDNWNDDAIGDANGPLNYSPVIRFTPEQLENIGIDENYFLNEINFILNRTWFQNADGSWEDLSTTEAHLFTFTLQAWIGGDTNDGYNLGTLVANQPIYNPVIDDWNNIKLDNPIPVDEDQEIWFGYNITYEGSRACYASACSEGPAIDSYGDLLYWDGVMYAMHNDFGLDYNWMINGVFTTSTGERIIANNNIIESHNINPTSINNNSYPTISPLDFETNNLNYNLPNVSINNINIWNTNSNRELNSYDIYRNGQLLTNYSDEYLFYTDQTVENLNEYCYSIIANYAQGESVSTEILCTTPYPGPPATNLNLLSYGNPIKLTWNNPNQGELGARILRDGNEHAIINDDIYYDSDNLVPGSEYCYQVQSIYESSFTFPTEEQCIIYDLYSPENLELISGNGSISLSWENLGIGLNEVEIYRDNEFLLSTTNNNFIDSNVSEQQSYCYQLISVYDNGISNSIEICGSPYYYQPPNEEIFSGVSSIITLDMIPPQIEVLSPSANQITSAGSEFTVVWNSQDPGGFSNDAINIYLSTYTVPSNFEVIGTSNNDQIETIILPEIQSENCQLMIESTDYYGNSSIAYSIGLFAITSDINNSFTISSESHSSSSSYFIIDQDLPTVEWIYPNDEEGFEGGSIIYPQWNASDESFDGEDIDIYLSESNGSEYNLIGSNIPHNGLVGITLPNISTTTASFRITITDAYGNFSDDYQESFISISNIEDEPFEIITESNDGTTAAFIIDQVPPTVEWIYPNGGELFNSNDVITTLWEANDAHFDSTDVSIFLSYQSGMEFELVGDNVPNLGEYSITLPDINSETAQFKLFAIDAFGNISTEDLADGFFSIGSIDNEFEITTESYAENSNLFIIDQVPPAVSLAYPNGGEHVVDYEEANIRFDLTEDNNQGTNLQVWVSHELGGWYVDTGGDYNADNGDIYVDLSVNGTVPERLYGLLKIQATDYFGNTSNSEYSDNYFILGDPRGNINLNYINQEEKLVLVDWSWIENQVIAITDEAIASLANYDYIKIYDENGITPTLCDEDDFSIESGLVELTTINISEEIGSRTVSLPCGFDYCSLGGSRIPGYYPGNTMKFSAGIYGENDQYQILPVTSQLVDEDMVFNNETFIINSFTIGDRINNTDNALSIDEREWDDFNVYGKITNHQGSTNRSCNDNGVCDAGESLVDCLNDCCPQAGTGENNEWCLLETVNGISTFQDNLLSGNYAPYVPAGTSSATFNYRVWLLDNNGSEVVKTIDTEINYESDDLVAYHTDLSSGWNWISLNIQNSEDMSLNNIFNNSELINTDYIKNQTTNSIYYGSGGMWYPDWQMNITSLYLVNVNQETSILYNGTYNNPSEVEVPIASGWNWIGYTPNTSSDINTALSLLNANNQDYIKGQTTSSIYYSSGNIWYPDINLEPNRGYMINVSENQTFFYPEVESNFNNNTLISRLSSEPNFNYRQYQYNASITIELDMPHVNISENDIIEVFLNNEQRGVAIADICPLNDKILFNLMLYSNNEVDKDLNFIYYSMETGEEYNIREKIDFEKDTILGNAYNPILLTDSAIPYKNELISPYPNPFNPSTTINFSLIDNHDNLSIKVYDIRGRLVKTLYSGFMPYGYHSIIWDASNFASGIYFINMITENNSFSKKITLLK